MVNAKSESIKVQIFLCGINLKKSLKAFWQTYTAQKKKKVEEKKLFKFIQTTLKDENCFYFCAWLFSFRIDKFFYYNHHKWDFQIFIRDRIVKILNNCLLKVL